MSQSAEPGIPTERRCQLTVLNGARSGTVLEVAQEKVRVGKGEHNTLTLPDATVSRDHFEIDRQGDSYLLRDLGSTNGLWMDQYRIKEAFLRPGAIIKAGDVELRFEPLFKPLEVPAWPQPQFGALVGRSGRMRQMFSFLDRVAKVDATVLILGETGSGKGAVARAIHEASPRKGKPFVVVDCGAIAENLIESELFGHERGAFTGATQTRRGALEQAAGGTLFIDELLELRLDLQPKLLRALEEREFRRVGASSPLKLDARILAASQKDLWKEVQAGKFREDLYFRLAVFTLPIPPLRERQEDIPMLAENFARQLPGGEKLTQRLTPQLLVRLRQHPWPGNVRELRNVVERALYLTDGMDVESLFQQGAGFAPGVVHPAPPLPPAPSSASLEITPPALPMPGMSGRAVPVAAPAVPAPVHLLPAPSAPAAAPLPPPSVAALAPAGGDTLALTADLSGPFKDAKERLVERFEQAYLQRLMERSRGQISQAARDAGIDRKHLYTLLKRYGLWSGESEPAAPGEPKPG